MKTSVTTWKVLSKAMYAIPFVILFAAIFFMTGIKVAVGVFLFTAVCCSVIFLCVSAAEFFASKTTNSAPFGKKVFDLAEQSKISQETMNIILRADWDVVRMPSSVIAASPDEIAKIRDSGIEIEVLPPASEDSATYVNMDETKARLFLAGVICPDNSLDNSMDFSAQHRADTQLLWKPERGMVTLDGVGYTSMQLIAIAGQMTARKKITLSADQLLALAWWMENKGEKS